MSDPIRDAGITIEDLPAQYLTGLPKVRVVEGLLSQINAVRKTISRYDPLLVHCFLPQPSFIGIAAARLRGFHPVIISKRSLLRRPQAFTGEKWLEKWALKSADRVLGNSTQVIGELNGIGIPADRMALIRNGIIRLPDRTDVAINALRAELGWPKDAVVLLVLANLIPYKGHAELLHALANQGLSDNPGWCVALAGSGTEQYASHLRQLAAELGIADRVIFMGQRKDGPRLATAANIGVLASHHEGSSNALLEYMAAGLPVVATAVGGNVDAITDGESGFLVPQGDTSALAAAIDKLIASPEQRHVFGERGKRIFEEHYTIDACVDAYNSFYHGLLDQQLRTNARLGALAPPNVIDR